MFIVFRILIFWVVMPCELIDRHQQFRGTYCLQPLKCWYLQSSPQKIANNKTYKGKSYENLPLVNQHYYT